MLDRETGERIQVKTHPHSGSAVCISLPMLPKVLNLLRKHNIRHWVAPEPVPLDWGPVMITLFLLFRADPVAIQELLDRPDSAKGSEPL